MSSDRPKTPFLSRRPASRTVAAEAVLAAAAAAAVAITVNAVRPEGLPLVASTPYQTLVPCPEPGGPVAAVSPDDPVITSDRSFIIDARAPHEFSERHLPGARNLPYDWLDPVPDDVMDEVAHDIAASRALRVVVYGDGGRPDSGEYLGREISGRGIKNVHVVAGGAPALFSPGAAR